MHLSSLHNSDGIVAIVDRSCILRCDAGKGQGRHALVGKGSGVTGVNAVLAIDTETMDIAQVLEIVNQFFFGSAAGDKTAHDAADHIQIDIENDLGQFFLVSSYICLGTQQSTFLRTAPYKA